MTLVKEFYILAKDPTRIFSIIEEELSKNINTQVFVDSKIFEELRKNGHKYHVHNPNYMKSWHYMHDKDNFGGEEWLDLVEETDSNKTIARGSFISNCKDYVQLVEFESSKIEDYTHFLAGFDNLLFIKQEITN